jgi:hypothetical protein
MLMALHPSLLVGLSAALAAAWVTLPRTARAGRGFYVQGRGVAGADAAADLRPGEMQLAHGTGVGWRLGARWSRIDGFVSRTDFGAGAGTDSAVLSLTDEVSMGNLRIHGATGLGFMRLRGGALGFSDGGSANGPLVRLAVGFDVKLGAGFWVGAELETAMYLLMPAGGSGVDDSERDSAVLGSVQLGFELGI